ncbi:DPOD3 polymerase, partial [Upupa epops]|nr:DPOD3 polymerase [Upupa epops]
AMKSKLAVIASVHVYSIQQALLRDSGPLYNTDYDIVKTNLHSCSKFSAIHCAAAVPRPPAEASRVQTAAQAASQTPSDSGSAGGPVLNGHGPSGSRQSSQQPRGIVGMFAAKAAPKAQDSAREAKAEVKEAPAVCAPSSRAPAKGNLINNFFGKAAMNKLKVSSVPEQPKEEKEAAKPSASVAEPPSSSSAAAEKPGRRAEATSVQQRDKKSRMKRVDKSDTEEDREPGTLKRKRRRVRQPVSDSSDEEGPCSPATPEEEKPPPPPPPPPALKTELEPLAAETPAGGKRRKRKRVLKYKMFLDEDE